MTEASTNKGNPIRRWFADRLETRIDRLWLGGVVGVNVAVMLLLGAKYIGIFLVAYFFIFGMVFRGKIESSIPTKGGIMDRIIGDEVRKIIKKNNISMKNLHKELIVGGGKSNWIKSSIIVMSVMAPFAFFEIVTNSSYASSTVSMFVVAVVFNFIFLAQHKKLFSTYLGGSEVMKDLNVTLHENKNAEEFIMYHEKLQRHHSAWTYVFSFAALTLLWGGVLFTYIQGYVGGDFFFGFGENIASHNVATIFPLLLHLFVLLITILVLMGWEKRSWL